MTEPTGAVGGSLLLATLTAALGPLFGEWTLIIVGGFVGSFLAVTAMETPTLKTAARLVLQGVVMSALFTGIAAALAAPHIGSSVDMLLLPVAGLIGWKQNRLFEGVWEKLPFGRKGSP